MSGGSTHRHRHARGRMPHEPALDGLRGVAVVLVVLFHGGMGMVGGALGVDVFFVLSGFLITALLLAEHDTTGAVDLRAFWGRRVRRLMPAALALVAVVAVQAAVAGTSGPGLRLDALSALGWWSNWRFAGAEVGYFASFAAPSPLRHTWSLGVEEQWYLFWPLLLLGLRRLAGSTWALLGAIGLLTVASATAMWLLAADVDRAHFGTDTRAQGLLAGAALAVLVHHRPAGTWSAPARRIVVVLGLAGAAVVGAMSWWLPGTDPRLYHGGHLVVAVATAAVIAASVLPTGIVRRALSPRPLRLLGRVSYGVYLWHWPVFVWLTPDWLGMARWPTFAVRIAVTGALTAASWKLLERPVLDRRLRLPRPRLALATGYVGVALLVLAATVPGSGGSGSMTIAAAEPTLPAGFVARSDGPAKSTDAASGSSAADTSTTAPPAPTVLDTPPAPDDRTGDLVVSVVGDSTAWSLGWALDPVPGFDVRDGGVIGCGLNPAAVVINGSPQVREGQPVTCDQAMDLWQWVTAEARPDVVVLGVGAWEVYDRELPDDGGRLDVGTPAWRRWVTADLERAGALLADAAPSAVIAVADVPCYHERNDLLGGPGSARNDPDRVAAMNDVLDAFVARHPARLRTLRLSDWLCDDTYERPDGIHLSPKGAFDLWTGPLGPAIRALSPRP